MPLNESELTFVRNFIREQAAIVLEPEKSYLIEARLQPLARRAGFSSLGELVATLRTKRHTELQRKVIEAMTTNETSWFRDRHPFEALKNLVIPSLMEKRAKQKALTFWCAASSSGQEPYSVLMVISEHFPQLLKSWKFRFIATDISHEMLRRTRDGTYSQIEINRGLPAPLLVRYFEKKGLYWQVKEELRKRIELRELNLAGTWPALPPIDVIFMRNVLIYFDVETKKQILAKVRRVMRPDGCFFLGGAETTVHLDDSFERIPAAKTGCYRLK